jgi:hypothetical protein
MGETSLSSFSAEQSKSADQEGSRIFDRMLERVSATVPIETQVGGRLVASTTVGLAGDFATAVDASASPEHHEVHLKSLALALRTRGARVRILLSTAQATLKIAVAMGTGNPLLAVPAARRFIRDLMAEYNERPQAA